MGPRPAIGGVYADAAAALAFLCGVSIWSAGGRSLLSPRGRHRGYKRVVGQIDAVKAVSKAIRRTRVGLKDPKRPSESFIFAGPSGIGKTELSKALAEFLFGSEDSLIQLDMS